MKKTHFLNELASKLTHAVPKNVSQVKKDIEKNFHGVLMSAFSKLELVTREEFESQKKVLARTRKKLEELEAILAHMESIIKQKSGKQ